MPMMTIYNIILKTMHCRLGFDERTNRCRRIRKKKPIPTAVPIPVFNTGLGPIGSPDPHYVVTASAAPYTIPSPALIADAFWSWPDPPAESIGVGNPYNQPDGDYNYQTTFDLTGFDPDTASLSFNVVCDDKIMDILLNGASTGLSDDLDIGFSDYWVGTPLTVTTGFIQGVNTLEFLTHNIIGSHAFAARVSGTAVPT